MSIEARPEGSAKPCVSPLPLHGNERMGLGAGLRMQAEMDDLIYLLEKRFLSEERRNGPKQVTLLREPS